MDPRAFLGSLALLAAPGAAKAQRVGEGAQGRRPASHLVHARPRCLPNGTA
jgi:hypothetical protein